MKQIGGLELGPMASLWRTAWILAIPLASCCSLQQSARTAQALLIQGVDDLSIRELV
jgi:hypothetical protein